MVCGKQGYLLRAQVLLAAIGLRGVMSAATLLAALAPVHAQSQSAETHKETAVQRQACKPDVFRLCRWYIPNRSAITYCLHKNIELLSPDCRAVMEGRLR